MSTDDRVAPAVGGFNNNAAAYERARPSYPAEAVAYIVGHGRVSPGRRVLDLAAGTGKLTRTLVPSGADIVAVEPVAAMRAQLSAHAREADVLDGTAEDIPLDDDSVDVITVAQAFHWFDPPVALAEMHRVLRPGGHLFILWNTRDRNYDWVRQWGELITDGERPYDSYYKVDYAAIIADDGVGRFGPTDTFAHEWTQAYDEELLVARAESVSVVGQMSPGERAATLDRIRHLARTHRDLAGRPWFDFPYITRVWHTTAL
jgi:SAM-dependent methyltransferase